MDGKVLSWDKQSSAEGTLYPVSREGHSLTFIPGKGILMFGGLGSSHFSELYFYDPLEHSWQLTSIKGRYPTPRCYHQSLYIAPFFIIYGGQGDGGRSLGDMYLLNLKDQKCEWKRVITSKPPESRHQHSIVGDDTQPLSTVRFMFGGINTPNNTFFNDTWVMEFAGAAANYDQGNPELTGIKIAQLSTSGRKPKERKGHISFIYNKKMFVYGGECEDIDFDTMRDIFMLDLSTYNWTNPDNKLTLGPFTWTNCENKSAEISPRSLMSCTWYNDGVLIVD